MRLEWHYRSRHESLIAFSNYHYYDNGLLTFPSVDAASLAGRAGAGRGVSLRHLPDARYDKGKSRTNRIEAEAVVADVVRRLCDPSLSKSICVVTFNIQQRDLIQLLLDDECRRAPELEANFQEGTAESVIVKNLENIQGDERDVVLFSIGFGPDAQGRVSMNFGAMNRDGGHRRLNVAITRARQEVVVFTSLLAEQIDLARTSARGVKDLKAFLDFARKRRPHARQHRRVRPAGGLRLTIRATGLRAAARERLDRPPAGRLLRLSDRPRHHRPRVSGAVPAGREV